MKLSEEQVCEEQPQQSSSPATRTNEEPIIWPNPDWTLTWPIWHMLPRHERKELAQKHGYRTIGEFEEYMSLQRAVGDASTDNLLPYDVTNQQQRARANSNSGTTTAPGRTNEELKPWKGEIDNDEDDEDEDDENSRANEEQIMDHYFHDEKAEVHCADSNSCEEERCRRGGLLLVLPEEALHKIFQFLPVDAYATLALVSPHWKSFTRTEAVYQRLCERLYFNQSHRRALHVSRFGNSYRLMLERRPRVKACGGLYVLKYAKIKKIDRNMWTDIPIGAVLELVYYRYLYFQEDGRVLYALTATPPDEMIPRLLRLCLTPSELDRAAVWGTYRVKKTTVTVKAQQEWQYVQLVLSIDTTNRLHGRYGLLCMEEHYSSKTGNFDKDDWRSDRIRYDVPEEPFRFIKDKRL